MLIVLLAFAILASAVIIWAITFFTSKRSRGRNLTAAGIVLALTVSAVALDLPLKARFAVSAPFFNQIVKQAGPPPATLDDAESVNMPIDCPPVVGLYLIDNCEITPGGYLFFDPLGTGLVDYAGFAYLPDHAALESTGAFELQDLTHIYGDWYAFTASW